MCACAVHLMRWWETCALKYKPNKYGKQKETEVKMNFFIHQNMNVAFAINYSGSNKMTLFVCLFMVTGTVNQWLSLKLDIGLLFN